MAFSAQLTLEEAVGLLKERLYEMKWTSIRDTAFWQKLTAKSKTYQYI